MRSRATNILQAVVLITGILYIVLGAVCYISPLFLGSLFGAPLAEDWFAQIRYDAVFAPIYFIAQAFSALLFTTGVSLVMPLFDPLRYRGLVYYTGVIFPLVGAIGLLRNGILYNHSMVTIMGVVFTVVFCITSAGLMITRNQAKTGEE